MRCETRARASEQVGHEARSAERCIDSRLKCAGGSAAPQKTGHNAAVRPPKAPAVESRMGAGADHGGRPVSHPRSSNRTCGFPASGFPTGFIADSRTRDNPATPEPEDSQLAVNPLHRKLTSTLRGYLVPPSQEMPYPFLHTLIDHTVCL